MPQSQIVNLASGGTLEVLEDGTKVQRNPDGTVLTLYPNGIKQQRTKDGIEIEVRPDGSRTQTMNNGVILEVMKLMQLIHQFAQLYCLIMLFVLMFRLIQMEAQSKPIQMARLFRHFLIKDAFKLILMAQ